MCVLHDVCAKKKGADQLCSHCTADLCLCFRTGKFQFSRDAAHLVKCCVVCMYYCMSWIITDLTDHTYRVDCCICCCKILQYYSNSLII